MAREKGYSAFLKKAIYIFERQIYFNYQTCIIKRASSTADASHAAACAVYKKLKLIKKILYSYPMHILACGVAITIRP